MQLVENRIGKSRITELPSKLITDRFDCELTALRIKNTGPVFDTDPADGDHQDRRKNRPPQLELKVSVNLNAERIFRIALLLAPDDREINEIADRIDHDDDAEERQELEQLVGLIGGRCGFAQERRQRCIVDVVVADRGDDTEQDRDRPESGAEALFRTSLLRHCPPLLFRFPYASSWTYVLWERGAASAYRRTRTSRFVSAVPTTTALAP